GWLYELAGKEGLDVDALLPPGERLEAMDSARGMRRLAVLAPDGSVEVALYLTRRGELPKRDWVASQIGTAAAGSELLAGRPSKPRADRGPIICVCLGVGARAIHSAARAGATTLAEIGSATGAGTNCGSCRPAIARMVEARLTQMTEAAE
ncbi:MAG TPA: (2Fe-2S)-binding protein, partial [Novosphingobium sp.]|nr:(2Fe-2S)-binding protein [Novosphingobium sp.]